MNTQKFLAALDLMREAVLEDEADIPPAPAASRPRAKSERRPRTLTRPERKVSDVTAAQAARVLKERGFT